MEMNEVACVKFYAYKCLGKPQGKQVNLLSEAQAKTAQKIIGYNDREWRKPMNTAHLLRDRSQLPTVE